MNKPISPRLLKALNEAISENEVQNTEILLNEDKLPLYPYQEDAVNFMEANPRCIIGDEMGLGKTLEVLARTKQYDPKGEMKILVVCPRGAKAVWQREIKKWLKEDSTIIDSAQGYITVFGLILQPPTRIIIINYETMREHINSVLQTRWGFIIFDEAHKMRNMKSGIHKSAKELCEYFAITPIAFVTGTPLVNNPGDLFSLLHLIDPWGFPSRKRFIDSWFDVYGSNQYKFKWGKAERFQQFISKYMIRRMRKDVIDLPPIKKIVTPIELEGEQLKTYVAMRDAWLAEFGKQEAVLATVLIAQWTRLKQICLAPHLMFGDDSCEGIKTEELIDLLSNSSGKTVITSGFSRYLRPLKKVLEAEGHGVGMFIGGMKEEDSTQQVYDFQNGNDMNVFLISHKAGGESITLTAADTFVYMDKPWTATNEDQLFGRIYRIGQEKKVFNYYLKAVNTIEDYIETVISRKRDLADEAIPIHVVRKMMLGG